MNRQYIKQFCSIVGTAGSGLSTVDPYPKKLRDTVNGRLKSDAIICTAIFVLTTLLHWSGFFARLQPNLNYVLWIMTGILGFSQHYVLPQLRKQLPWLCFSHPILKSREYGQFEVGCLVFIILRFLQLRSKYNEIFFFMLNICKKTSLTETTALMFFVRELSIFHLFIELERDAN